MSLPKSDYINLHCHRRTAKDRQEIVSIDTSEFTQADGQGFYSLGIHPWFIDRQDAETALQKIVAVADDLNLLAIGECGLDRAINLPLTAQIAVFDNQIKLSERFRKPLIIHCVSAFNDLVAIKKAVKPTQPWIIHGFSGKPQLAAQLLKQDLYLCFGKALLQENSKTGLALTETPLQRLFLETDTADVPIGMIYASAAKILGMDLQILQQQILINFKRVFLHE